MNTSLATTHSNSKVSSIVYALLIFLLTFFFHKEYAGINFLLSAVLLIPIFWIISDKTTNHNWFGTAAIYLICSIGVMVHPSLTAIIATVFSFSILSAISLYPKFSIPIAIVQACYNFSFGFVLYIDAIVSKFGRNKRGKSKWLINFLLFSIPITIALIFLKLYQSADESFAELTDFINLEWISMSFLITYFCISFLLFGFIYCKAYGEFKKWEDRFKNKIQPSYTDRLQQFFGISNEIKIAFSLLIILNLMLLLYNVLDVNFVFTKLGSPERGSSISQLVHGGVNSLIFSIVLVILITTYIFRGKINSLNNKWIKNLTFIWLFQNITMLSTTAAKNMQYVLEWGLTYKRIGVFIYLLLALIGLLLTIYKVFHQKSFWFLLRKSTFSFFLILSLTLTFNWNRLIAHFNTSYIKTEKVDTEYLLSLGHDTYSYLIDFHIKKEPLSTNTLTLLKQKKEYYLNRLSEKNLHSSWLSFNWTDYNNRRELEHIKFNL